MKLTVVEAQAWLNEFTKQIEANKALLSDLDTPIGDGDHGNNMARGVQAYQEAFEKQQPQTLTDTFKVISMAMISKVGGASGPLYGSAFMGMMKAMKDMDEVTSTEELTQVISAGLTGIKQRGKAEVGDKTMVDVWSAVVDLLAADELTKEGITTAKEATKELVAKKGRASYLGERAIGHIDPGAASSALLFESLLTVIQA
ncbi:dihydroxyacetone kinase subunit DhaL [Vagococcus sp.]|uniref:dihydroxyacetone kinase subunit DhaL n=1 Tax=Vagococcus sp. TaxID=1933889 RepID=UPI003F943383